MKNISKKLMSAVLSVSMLASTAINFPVTVSAADEMTVTVSMEGLTLGQGMYFEPETYTLSEINEIVAAEGYGPFDEDNLNAGMATLAFFIENGIEYDSTGSWGDGSATVGSSIYISQIKNVDKGYLNIPQVILDKSGMSVSDFYENDDEWLGEFDYNSMSGWMITVNDLLIPVGASSWNLKQDYNGYNNYDNNYVVRWQFTLNGYGADLGLQGFAGAPYYERANKDLLYMKYAELSANGTFNSNPELKTQALAVMEKLDATQNEVDNTLSILESAAKLNVNEVLNDTLSKMVQAVPEPKFGTFCGEWTVLSLARAGYFDKDSDYFKGYYDRIVDTVNETAASVNKNGALHSRKYTENSRLIMALSAIGKDAHSVGNWDIVAPLEDFDATVWQGINGPIFALIALDTHNYKTTDTTIRQQYIDYILNKEIDGGGWALSGAADPDITAMAIQALSRYMDNSDVAAAVERGINKLSSMQKDNGGYASWGSINSESIAQVIVACTALGIDPNTDPRFVKNGHSAVDALLEFYNSDSTDFAFSHVIGDGGNAMATDQASYALVAYQRFVNKQRSLYDMNDVAFDSDPVKFGGATVTLGGNIGVNFHMLLADSVISDSGAYMQFELPDGKVSSMPVSDAKQSVIDGTEYYVFPCEIPAKEMSEDITAQIILGDGTAVGTKQTYSVSEYADSINKGDYTDETKTLVKAMTDYGKYAKAYFNNDITVTTTDEISAVTDEVLADFAMKSSGSLPDGIKYYGSSLLLESDTKLRHYFRVADGTGVENYNFSGNKGNYYYIDVADIQANMLGKTSNVTVGDYTISYSPMSYAYAVLASDITTYNLKTLVSSLYLYNQAAVNYQK